MDSESMREYSPPPFVSQVSSYAKLPSRNSSASVASWSADNLPNAHDLTAIKTDLESILRHTEQRLKNLRKDMNHVEKNIKVQDTLDDSKKSSGSFGKNVDATTSDKVHVKQESLSDDEVPDQLLSSTPRLQDTPDRRRRREDTDLSDQELTSDPRGRSESPHPDVRAKKLARNHSISTESRPSSNNQTLKQETVQSKRKKPNSNPARTQTSSGNLQQHLGSGKQPKEKPATTKASNNDVDFVRVKPKDQVPVLTFWAAVEPYFRPLTEEDRKFLCEKNDNVGPHLIPPLGRHYLDQWAEEENLLYGRSAIGSPKAGVRSRQGSHDHTVSGDGAPGQSSSVSSPAPNTPTESRRYLRKGELITEDYLLTKDLSCGSLTERLLSSLVLEDIADASVLQALAAEEDEDAMDTDVPSNDGGRTIVELATDPTQEIVEFEERLKRELRYAGLFGDEDIDWNAREDDEICAELRRLGRELQQQTKANEFRKKQLLEVVDQQLQYEQYRHVLDTLDSQVEQCYLKRFRVQKSKKRKSQSSSKATLSENTINAMEKRRMWIQALEPIFKDKNVVLPVKSIYETADTDTAADASANADNENVSASQ